MSGDARREQIAGPHRRDLPDADALGRLGQIAPLLGEEQGQDGQQAHYCGASAIFRFLMPAPVLSVKRAQPCQLFFSLRTLKTRTFSPFLSVTAASFWSFSSVRVSSNLMTSFPLRKTFAWSFEPILILTSPMSASAWT